MPQIATSTSVLQAHRPIVATSAAPRDSERRSAPCAISSSAARHAPESSLAARSSTTPIASYSPAVASESSGG